MSARLRAIVASMNVLPSDRVLEIGCGHGVAATCICERLSSGRYAGIDRSKKMIQAALRRNAVHVASGRATFIVADAVEADFGKERFDKILAVRVALFHREPECARSITKRWLAPRGKLFIHYDVPR